MTANPADTAMNAAVGSSATDAAHRVEAASGGAPAELLRLRDSIDNLDAALIHLLAERFKLTRTVGEFKATHDLPPADPGREARQIERLRALSQAAHLDPVIAEKYLTFVVTEVVRHHEAIAAEHRSRTAD